MPETIGSVDAVLSLAVECSKRLNGIDNAFHQFPRLPTQVTSDNRGDVAQRVHDLKVNEKELRRRLDALSLELSEPHRHTWNIDTRPLLLDITGSSLPKIRLALKQVTHKAAMVKGSIADAQSGKAAHRKPPGRKRVFPPAAVKRVYEQWKASGLSTKDYARQKNVKFSDVAKDCCRHRANLSRARTK